MGIFKELGKAVFETIGELGVILKDTSDEFREIMTDGFKEMVIKDNPYYQTSFEKMDSAIHIFNSAKSRYKSACEELENYYSETMDELNEHVQYKMNFCKGSLAENQNTVNRVINVNLDEQIVEKPFQGIEASAINDYKKSALSIVSIGNSKEKFSSTMGIPFIWAIESNWFITQKKRVLEADSALEDAKEFRAKVDLEIEELNVIKAKLHYVREIIKEEKNLLQRFENVLERITFFLNSTYQRIEIAKSNYQSKNIFGKLLYKIKVLMGLQTNEMQLTEDERKKIISDIEISKMLSLVINTHFINEDFEISSDYEQVITIAKEFESDLIERGI